MSEISNKADNKGDFIEIIIPFNYFYLRSYYQVSKRWGQHVHIALNEEYKFKIAQVTIGNPICGRLEDNRIFNSSLKPWTPGRKGNVKVCQNCITKLMTENKLHIQSYRLFDHR